MKKEEALTKLKEAGYKHTGKRTDIIDFFSQVNGYRTAKDLLQHMSPYYKNISFDTIYRNLHLFDELDILESTELNGEKHFRLSCAQHHHHHFICRECGLTKAIHCPMENVGAQLSQFTIEDHKFEIYGKCPDCQLQ